MKARANSLALKGITEATLARGLQVSRSNPLLGVGGRATLLNKLGHALEAFPEFFGSEVQRPGNMVDYLLSKSEGNKVGLEHLWRVCAEGLNSIWPLQPNGIIRGDVWTHSSLKTDTPGSDLVPFHKLTQWLVYSVIDSVHHVLGLQVSVGTELVVEWRALTVVLLDRVAEEVRKKLGKS